MKLSMWNIFYALSEREKMSLIKEGKQTILSARWIVSSKLNSDMVYVGRESEYFDVSDENVLIVHRHDMIIVYNADPAEIFNEICSIIDRFAQWETELQKCLKLEDGLTKMLDCSREFLKNPSYIYAPDGRSLAIASDFPKSIHWHWAEIIENGGLTDERMENLQETISLTDVFQDRFPTIRDSAMGNHQYMHVSIIVNGYMAGHFVMFSFLQPFYEGDIHIVDNLAVYLGKYMETHFADYSPTTKMGRIVTALIFHKEYEKRITTFAGYAVLEMER